MDKLLQQLHAKYGRGRIVRNADKIMVVAKLHLVKNDQQVITAKQVPHYPITAADDMGDGDFLKFRFVLTSAGANLNNQVFVEDEIANPAVYSSVVGEPVDEDHDQSFRGIVGDIIASEFIPAASSGINKALIKCRGVIFKKYYPEAAFKVQIGAGRWACVSMEALPNPLEEIGPYLIVHNPKFVGAGLVRFPGCEDSQIEQVQPSNRKFMIAALQAAANSIFI